MQLMYAAPFMLLSVLAFFTSLAIPRLRPYTFRVLVAPVAFGFCSLFGMVIVVLFSSAARSAPVSGPSGTIFGLLIYLVPGLFGAWLAVEVVKRIEGRWSNTQPTRDLAIRTIISLIVFGPALVVYDTVLFKFFEPWESAHEYLFLSLALMAATMTALLAYSLLRAMQQRLLAQAK